MKNLVEDFAKTLILCLGSFALGMTVIILQVQNAALADLNAKTSQTKKVDVNLPNETKEIVCDHPDWKESGFAAVSAKCGPFTVTILD